VRACSTFVRVIKSADDEICAGLLTFLLFTFFHRGALSFAYALQSVAVIASMRVIAPHQIRAAFSLKLPPNLSAKIPPSAGPEILLHRAFESGRNPRSSPFVPTATPCYSPWPGSSPCTTPP